MATYLLLLMRLRCCSTTWFNHALGSTPGSDTVTALAAFIIGISGSNPFGQDRQVFGQWKRAQIRQGGLGQSRWKDYRRSPGQVLTQPSALSYLIKLRKFTVASSIFKITETSFHCQKKWVKYFEIPVTGQISMERPPQRPQHWRQTTTASKISQLRPMVVLKVKILSQVRLVFKKRVKTWTLF